MGSFGRARVALGQQKTGRRGYLGRATYVLRVVTPGGQHVHGLLAIYFTWLQAGRLK